MAIVDPISGGSRGRDHGPSGDRVPAVRDRHPSNRQSIVLRHGAAVPSGRQDTEGASNIQRAIYSDFPLDTSSPRPKRNRDRAWRE